MIGYSPKSLIALANDCRPATMWHCWELLQLLFEGSASKPEKPCALGCPKDVVMDGNLTCELALKWLTAKSYYLPERLQCCWWKAVALHKSLIFQWVLEVMKGTWCRLTIPKLENDLWHGFHTTDIHNMAQPHMLFSCLCGCICALSFPDPTAFLFLWWEIKFIIPRYCVL